MRCLQDDELTKLRLENEKLRAVGATCAQFRILREVAMDAYEKIFNSFGMTAGCCRRAEPIEPRGAEQIH